MFKKFYDISVEADKLHNQYNRNPTEENKQLFEEKQQELNLMIERGE